LSRSPTRRTALQGLAAAALWPSGCTRRSKPTPDTVVDTALADLELSGVVDSHVHIVGLGAGGTGCWVNPMMLDPVGHPVEWARFQIYQHASGVTDIEKGDAQYVDTLLARLAGIPISVRAMIFAFDQVYGEDGTAIPEQTMFHTPNDYVLDLAAAHAAFVPVAGIHPFRRDAADEVHRVAEAGAVAVKWLPNAQRFDPASVACDSFYQAMAQRGLVLITHGGHEMAVESADAQRFGDPLRLRRALDSGVQVVVAHCASSGAYPDGDDPDGAPVSAFDLFLRLMDTPDYHGQLFGEISAVTLFNRVGGVLRRLLERTDLHDRLIHGSDYPLPAIDPLIQMWQLVAEDLVSAELRAPLSALFDQNPLLFDLVLKRTVCLGGDERTRFPARMFQGLPGLFSA
jgi:predicted TIM-barrel fold metal-dependent hydrolase